MSKNPTRILHLIDTTGPGGAETIYVSLADFTRRKGSRALASVRGAGWVKTQLEAAGILTHVVDCKGSFNLAFLRDLLGIIRRENIDLIQAHLLGSNVYACLAGLLTNTPVVCTFHGSVDVAANERFAWAKFLLIRLGARKIIAVSDQLKRDLSRYLPEAKLSVIHNGIDLNLYPRIRPGRDLSAAQIRLGSLGNIREAKDYFTAIRAVDHLKRRGYEVRFEIAGGGKPELQSKLQTLVEELGLEREVIFLGFIDKPANFLESLDVYLLSSSSEGHPLALVQAMAAGLPIVATRCGVEEVLTHEVDSLLVPVGKPEAMADAIERLATDGSLRNEVAKRARALAISHYSVDAMHEQYWNIYCSA